ncbi:MAG: Fe/S biogenesis protein NfuA [Euryarchaeota archaeon]|nr:Fe/S biogenesis protein NfuA [Euryarchaeota archaeon]|tara:strand:- start:1313 stop:1984 length:672 start_codon:yes stop_codon:yes gene_type:complete
MASPACLSSQIQSVGLAVMSLSDREQVEEQAIAAHNVLEITDKAREMLDTFLEKAESDEDMLLKIEIVGRGPKGFQYDLQLVSRGEALEDDLELEIGGLAVLVGSRSVPYLEGTILDYKETLMGGGFSFENPNPMWIDDVSKAVAEVIADQVNPVVATHGGHVDLIGVDEGKAMIAFGGGCQGCGMVDVTLKEGIEVMITEGVPQISEVVDMTDHAAGTNPFY